VAQASISKRGFSPRFWGDRYTGDGFGNVTGQLTTRNGALLAFLTFRTLTAQQPTGFVHGMVLDPAGAVFVGIEIEVASRDHACKTTSNQQGKFNCQLPPGRYNVSATGRRLMPYRRATVNVEPSSHVFLKLRPVLRAAPLHILDVGPNKLNLPPDPTIGYEEQAVGNGDVLVQYTSSTKKDGQIIFRRPHLTLTIDALAVYADEITCSNPIRACTARGALIADLGEEQLEGTMLEIDVSSRKFVLTRDPNVARTF